MAVLMTMDIPATKDQYDQVNEELGGESNLPDGLLIHTAEETGNGMHIVDVWESQGAFEKFSENELGPAVGKVIGEPPEGQDPPQPEFHELANVIKP